MLLSRWEFKPRADDNRGSHTYTHGVTHSDQRPKRILRQPQGKKAFGSGRSSVSAPSTRPSSAEENPLDNVYSARDHESIMPPRQRPDSNLPLRRRPFPMSRKAATTTPRDTPSPIIELPFEGGASGQGVCQEFIQFPTPPPCSTTPNPPSTLPSGKADGGAGAGRPWSRRTDRGRLNTAPKSRRGLEDENGQEEPSAELLDSIYRSGMNNGIDLRKSHPEHYLPVIRPPPASLNQTRYRSRQIAPIDRNDSVREASRQASLASARARIKMEQWMHTSPRLAEYLTDTHRAAESITTSRSVSKDAPGGEESKKEAGEVGHLTYNPTTLLQQRYAIHKKGRDFAVWSFRRPGTARG